jgi:hypothetical protein
VKLTDLECMSPACLFIAEVPAAELAGHMARTVQLVLVEEFPGLEHQVAHGTGCRLLAGGWLQPGALLHRSGRHVWGWVRSKVKDKRCCQHGHSGYKRRTRNDEEHSCERRSQGDASLKKVLGVDNFDVRRMLLF